MDNPHILYLPLMFLLLLEVIACCAYYGSLCSQTPYPELCSSSLSENVYDLRDQSNRATLDEAHKLLISINDLGPSEAEAEEEAELGRAALSDCLDLYEDTLHHLNRSLYSKNPSDAQTWLSAAVANEQTCQNGFLDFNLSPYLTPTDFPKLLSNSLAINKGFLQTRSGRRDQEIIFPEWVSAAARKLLQSSPKPNIVVSQDGSGTHNTISAALAAARTGTDRFVIYVKKGIYKENVEVKKSMRNLMLIGDGIDETIITGSKNVHDGSTTFRSATFGVSGDGFIARGITFENTAGAEKHQAVAVRSSSDKSVFYECSFKGYQDTLYVYSNRQFYRNCDIYGTLDFIFGDAVSVFQNCNIYVRKAPGLSTITAQGKKDPNENTGIVIHNSQVAASSHTYLGRPWQKYSTTVFLKCRIDGFIDPAGWLPWSGNFALTTLYYGEYMNTGPGAATSRRVNWPGFHLISTASQAAKFSVHNFLAGDSWIPQTGVPFVSGL